MDLQNNASFSSMPSFAYYRNAFSECVAKLVHGVVLLYLVVSSALLVAATVRRELQGINFRLELLASIVFNNNHGQSLPTL